MLFLKKKKKSLSPWHLISLAPQGFYTPDLLCRPGHELHISERHYSVFGLIQCPKIEIKALQLSQPSSLQREKE